MTMPLPVNDVAVRTGTRARRTVIYVCGALVACAAIVVIAVGAVLPTGRTLEVAGLVGHDALIAAIAVGLWATTALLLAARRRTAWLAVVAGLLAGIATLVLGFVAPSPLVPVRINGCPSTYVVDDSWGDGSIYRQTGLMLHRVAYVVTDDGYRPFSSGGYRAEKDAEVLQVWYFQATPRSGDVLGGPPALTLPADGVACD